MNDLLKLTAVFVVIVILLRKKYQVGNVMLAASLLLGVLYLMPPMTIVSTIKAAAISQVTLKLIFSLTLIRVFELILRENGVLSAMTEASRSLFRKRRFVIISMPMIIGMLPSLGGAYFSAPMVKESTKGLDMPDEEKAFINFWFRHPWEFILPLYPGLLLASALTGIELRRFILANLACAAVMFVMGFIFSMRRVEGAVESERLSWKGLSSFIPVALVIALVALFHMELHTAFLLLISGLFIYFRYTPVRAWKTLWHGVSRDVIVLIAGVMLFKEAMASSGAVSSLGEFFVESGIPFMLLAGLLPFISGLLTGITVGAVGSTFPLLMHLTGGQEIAAASFAFVSAYIGVLLSPVHVCLVLTREYFDAEMRLMYRRMIPACAAIFIAAVAQYILLR